MLDFAKCEQLVSQARDKRSKPVQNNTRVEKRDSDTYALRLHATDIATIHRDGRITVNTGGWRTVTTLERLRGWIMRRIVSEHGLWYVQAEPDPNDPQPPHGERTVPKPFHALDPGPEPVKPAKGCLAGTSSERDYDDEVLVSRDEVEQGAEIDRPMERENGYFAGYRTIRVREIIDYGEASWGEYVTRGVAPEGIDRMHQRYEQCPHCKLFNEQRHAWEQAMHGGGWGRNRTHGYAKMVELLERYGSREAWQDACIADFRAAREQRKVYKEWVERNRVPFEDGMELTANGYAKRPDLKAIAREQRKLKRIEKQKKRINKFVANAVDALANGLPLPSGGDCWYCALSHAPQDSERPPGAISMGDSMPTLHSNGQITHEMSTDHLEQHIKERYYVPSMFVNALRESGYQDVGIYMLLGMDPDNDRMGGERISRDTITRDLRRYLYKRLVPELAR